MQPSSRSDPSQTNLGTVTGPTRRRTVQWIRSTAIPLATVEPRQGYSDLEPLRAIIGDARIVSLGEATHGTREFFKLKHRLLEFCVAELGFTVFGIEANFPESLAVNAYVLDGFGDAADALAGMRYWTCDTEEVLDLIEWMRWWNANNARKVKFYGFVTAYTTVAVLGLINFLVRVAPELAATCETELLPLASDFTARMFGQISDTRRRAVFACIAEVLAAFAQQRKRWITATSAIDWHLSRLHAIVLDRAARFAEDPSSAAHDCAMADNVNALLEAEGDGAKAVLWAHNVHVAHAAYADGENTMGKNLDKMAQRAHIVIGFSFDRGSFQARDYPSGRLVDHRAPPTEPNSFESVLAQTDLPLFALDLKNAPRKGSVATWLASEIPMRSIGGIYDLQKNNKYGITTYAHAIVPREQFDVVMFVAETTAARANQLRIAEPALVALSAPSNLDLSGEGVPARWRIAGSLVRAVLVSDEPSPSGGLTVCLARDARAPRWGDTQLIQKVSAQAWHGKRVRFSGAMRTMVEGLGSGALLFVKFLARPYVTDESDFFATEIAVAASSEQPVQSPQWATFAVEANVPEAADSFLIGLVVTGSGAAWFGDLQFTVVTRPD
jgi:erythromycin esterase